MLVVDHAGVLAGEVEVAVVRQVHDGRLVGRRLVIDAEGVVVGQGVRDGGVEVAGVAFLAVLTEVVEADGRAVLALRLLGAPDDLVETLHAAVEVVGAVVRREGVLFAVEGELALGDAVGVAAGDGAEERVAGEVAVEVLEAEDDVAGVAVLVRHVQLGDDAAVVGDLGDDAVLVGEGVQLHRLPFFRLAEVRLLDSRLDGGGRRAAAAR
jgi:hypothetical protein